MPVLELPDGGNVVRSEDLDVGNSPDLVVVLSQSELTDDRDAYHEIVNIGALNGNEGNQNYDVRPEVELEDYRTVAIWCRRFN